MRWKEIIIRTCSRYRYTFLDIRVSVGEAIRIMHYDRYYFILCNIRAHRDSAHAVYTSTCHINDQHYNIFILYYILTTIVRGTYNLYASNILCV